MRVAMPCYGCIRVFKEARALRSRGHEVQVFCLSEISIPIFREPARYRLVSRRTMLDEVRSYSPDIVHVHNEPDWPVSLLSVAGLPVVLDVHDMSSLRSETMEPSEDERRAFADARGIIHVGPGVARRAREVHGYQCPELVLPPYPLEEHAEYELGPRGYQSVVYQGGVTSEVTIRKLGIPHYRNYLEAAKAFIAAGYGFTIYPARDQPLPGYLEAGVDLRPRYPYDLLIQELRKYGLGLFGSFYDNPLMQLASPNKLFEYLVSSVIPVAWNSSSAMEWLAREGLGLSANTLLSGRIDQGVLEGMTERIYRRRREWTMEAHVPELLGFYEEVLNG